MKTNNPQRRRYIDCTEEQKLDFREAWSKGGLLKLGNDAKWGDKTRVGHLLDGDTYAVEIKEEEESLNQARRFRKCLWREDNWFMCVSGNDDMKHLHENGYSLKTHPSDTKSESLKVAI